MSIFPAEGPLQKYADPPKGHFQVHNYPKVALHDGVLHAIHDGYRRLNPETSTWEPVDVPFTTGAGMTITSTPKGLVVCGGELEGSATSEIWICLQGKWRPISASIQPRAHHACAWVPAKNALLVHGGFGDSVLSDFELVDLDSGTVTEIEVNQKLALTNHTVTVLDGTRVIVFGGLNTGRHLNDRMFEVDLATGKVQSIAGDHGLAVRCSHLAFEYFGCLCVTGGFKMGEKVQNASLFDFTNCVWLTITFGSELLPDTWFAMRLPTGFWLLNSTFSEGKVVYYNQNRQPFVDANDDQLVKFFARVMEVNSASNILKKVEKLNVELLTKVEEVRRKLAETIEKKDPGIRAFHITEKISERDQLEQKLINLDIFSGKQMKRRNEKRLREAGTVEVEWPQSGSSPTALLREIGRIRKTKREEIAQLSEQCAKLHEAVEARFKFGSMVLQLGPHTDDIRTADKALEVPEMAQQIKLNQANIDELDKEIAVLRKRNMSIEESWIEAASHLQELKDESHSLEKELCDYRRRFYQKQKEFIMAHYSEVKCQALERDRSDIQEFNRVQGKIESYIEEMEKYKIRVPDNLNKLIAKLKILLDMSPDTEPEKVKRIAAELLSLLTGIVELHNRSAELIEDKSEYLTRVATPDSWRSEIEKGNLRTRTETVVVQKPTVVERRRHPTNFSRRTFDLENAVWCQFYNQIVLLIEQVNEQEKNTNI